MGFRHHRDPEGEDPEGEALERRQAQQPLKTEQFLLVGPDLSGTGSGIPKDTHVPFIKWQSVA